MAWETTDVMSADTAVVLSADTTVVLSADATDVLSADTSSSGIATTWFCVIWQPENDHRLDVYEDFSAKFAGVTLAR